MSDGEGRSRRGWGLIGGLGVVVVALAAYGGLALTGTDRIPSGTKVDGVIVGGQSKAAAQKRIQGHIAALERRPVTFTAAGRTLSLMPATSGLGYDAAGALDGLTGFTLSPGAIRDRYNGGPARSLKPTVDKVALQKAITAAAASMKGAPVSGTVKFVAGQIKVTHSTSGRVVDAAALAGKIATGWPATRSYAASMVEQTPQITDTTVDAFAAGPAKKAIAGPVTFQNGGKTADVTASRLCDVLRTVPNGAALKIAVIPKEMAALAESMNAQVTSPAKNAKVAMNGIVPTKTVIAGSNGTKIDPVGTGAALVSALHAGRRTVPVKVTQQNSAAVDPAQISSTVISEFRSQYPLGASNAARTENIKNGLAKLNGTYIAPGQQFSLLAALQPFTEANGYVKAPVLVSGRDVYGLGGGSSQVSTTMYNATFFAGLQEDTHKAHSTWISRYPMGREATLSVPTIDNRWTNDSGHGIVIVIEARTESDAAVMRLYGTNVFSVTSNTGPRFALSSPGAQRVPGAGCIPQDPVAGFKVTVTRVVKKAGKVVKNESLTTTYSPADLVTCTG